MPWGGPRAVMQEVLSCGDRLDGPLKATDLMITAVDHVQLAMPPGGEDLAVRFYEGILGIPRIPKPPNLAGRGGCWFESRTVKVHLGVEVGFIAARKAHPGLLVDDLARLVGELERAGHRVVTDEPLEGYGRAYVDDPFGNRVELLEAIGQTADEVTATGVDIETFRTFGFVVLRGAFDPGPLSNEMDRCFADGLRASFEAAVGGGVLGGAYLPMMSERTPVSLSLLERFVEPAADLLGSPVLPVRAKGVRYFASANWHHDSDQDVASVGFVAYLDRLDADNGALRLIPGSHRHDFGRGLHELISGRSLLLDDAQFEAWSASLPGCPVPTDPGDVIAFDEHLYHASFGGRNRRQWRVDYVKDPVGADEEAKVRSFFSRLYQPDWDGGYDVDRYPSYGAHLMASGRPWVRRLAELGACEAADREEDFARSRRR